MRLLKDGEAAWGSGDWSEGGSWGTAKGKGDWREVEPNDHALVFYHDFLTKDWDDNAYA